MNDLEYKLQQIDYYLKCIGYRPCHITNKIKCKTRLKLPQN